MQRELSPLPGVETVSLEFDVMSPEEKTALTTRLRGGVNERTKGISLDRSTRVIAVASGKGGVGKSTLTATSQLRSTGSASVSECSTPTCTGTRSRTCSASTSARSWSTA